ncbi:MAG: dipeptidase [Solirubrobacteraceae bacterium]
MKLLTADGQNDPATNELAAYLADARARHLDELSAFASFASVSALERHRSDVLACADWVQEQVRSIGLRARQLDTGGNPAIYGEWIEAGPQAPTILLYGHYDVQPPEPLELWTTPPFEPTVRDGAMFARGISDDKGPTLASLKGIEACLAVEGALPCNVKVLIEGEEELRSDHFDALIDRERELLAADLLVNSDGSFLAPGVPSVAIGLRGMVALELTVSTAAGDLHSGLFGGVAPNALHVLVELLSTLHDADGRVDVDGFHDDVAAVPARERDAWARLPIDEADVLEQARTHALIGDPSASLLDRLWALPTLDLHGIWGGFQGEGVKTVIPAQAHAKLSCRLVSDQRMHDVLAKIEAHLERHLPAYARLRIDSKLEGTPPMLLSADHPGVSAALRALAAGHGAPAMLARIGASVPVNEMVQRHLGMPAVMLGASSPTDAFHAPDEHFALASFDGCVRSMVNFLKLLPELWAA